jgi:hypothetical protein
MIGMGEGWFGRILKVIASSVDGQFVTLVFVAFGASNDDGIILTYMVHSF